MATGERRSRIGSGVCRLLKFVGHRGGQASVRADGIDEQAPPGEARRRASRISNAVTAHRPSPQCVTLKPRTRLARSGPGSLFGRCQHLFGDRASVVLGGAVVGNARAKPDQAADAHIREPEPTTLVDSPQDLFVAVVSASACAFQRKQTARPGFVAVGAQEACRAGLPARGTAGRRRYTLRPRTSSTSPR
jgi:hypothetical protein